MAILTHILLLGLFILIPITTGKNDKRPLVTTKYGQLLGITVPVKEISRVVDVFYGVPFAKPPVGPLRFANPEPPEHWHFVRDASKLPPMCIQSFNYMKLQMDCYRSPITLPLPTEDCLYLDVYTPADRRKNSKLPVMVFVPGGALVFGAASMYDGSVISAYENVVVVSIQYRLGVLGFFSTGDGQLRGNYGFMDQVAALRWIQKNIGAFGGDHKSVTIFGHSAGSLSVTALVLSPLSKGLFHHAIAESGTVTMPGFVLSNSEELIPFQESVANISGCDLSSIADCLKKKSQEEFLTMADTMGLIPFPASVDGVFLPKPVEEIMANGEGNKVPLLIGINNMEFGFILPLLYNITGLSDGMTRESVVETLHNIPFMPLSNEVVSALVDEYLGYTTDPLKIRDHFLDLCGDALFVMQALKFAKYHRDLRVPVYFYEFQRPPAVLALLRPKYVKCDHGDELIFVFGGPFLRDGAVFALPATPRERILSKTVMKYWANFARTGNPNGYDLTTWLPYGSHEHYLGINLQQQLSSKLKEEKFVFWTEILPAKMKSQAAAGGDRTEL